MMLMIKTNTMIIMMMLIKLIKIKDNNSCLLEHMGI
jgi:hypothetical protein